MSKPGTLSFIRTVCDQRAPRAGLDDRKILDGGIWRTQGREEATR